MTIRSLLAVNPDGTPMAAPLTNEEIGRHLFDNYLASHKEMSRRRNALWRRKLYTDDARDLMEEFLARVFDDPENRERYRKVINEARYNNVIKRITHELSTVYRLRARRSVGDTEGNERYKLLHKRVHLNDLMRRFNRYLNLYRDVVLYFRVRDVDHFTAARKRVEEEARRQLRAAALARGEDVDVDDEDDVAAREPVLEIVTPDRFYAVSAPHDPTQLVALIIDQKPSVFEKNNTSAEIVKSRRKGSDDGEVQAIRAAEMSLGASHYLVLTNHERFRIDERGNIIPDSWHSYAHLTRMPAILAHAEPPDGCLLDGTTGADLVAAHMAVWLQNVMLVKESKALSRQVAYSGDLSTAARGQSIDSETDFELPEGVSAQTIDRGLDPQAYMRVARQIVEDAAANHGIAPSVLRHDGASSGHELDLRRIPIRERRQEQEETYRDIERELAEIMSEVTSVDMPSLTFDTEGWRIDFGDMQTPMSTSERLDVFEKERRAGLTSTVRFMRERNPDLDDDAAAVELKMHIDEEVERNIMMRPLMQISGSMGAELPGASAGPGEHASDGDGERVDLRALARRELGI